MARSSSRARGRVRVFRDGALALDAALDAESDVAAADGRVLGVSLDAAFEKTRFLYMLYAAAAGRGEIEVLLARFRGVADRFGERAVLLARSISQDSTEAIGGALRVGADGKLFVALDGEILRLNSDATTPDDHVPFTPVYADGHAWLARSTGIRKQRSVGGRRSILGRASRHGDAVGRRAAASRSAYSVPAAPGHRAAIGGVLSRDAIPGFRGDLFIAGRGAS
jgi:glucose/arabinose dehydrogenase